jgi:phage terminase large subunit
MATLDIKHTNVFTRSLEALNNTDVRFIIEQGGSRSSKTYSLCQMIIVYCLTTPNKIISIIRKTFPTLRGTVMRDFFEVMNELNLYQVNQHNKTENIYRFPNGSMVEFFGADNEQKLRGRKRDILWINEANELNFEEFTQLNMRTTEKLIFDFNPSENFHWLYDLIMRKESVLIHSTYKDNPFLGESQINEIEELINYDESYYRIYALGEKGAAKTTIYTHWKYFEGDIETADMTIYGVDFGYNHPNCLIECKFKGNDVYVKELIYQSGLTSDDLVQRIKDLNIDKRLEIICDGARPEMIEDIKRAGFNAKVAIKEVKKGIDSVKSSGLFIDKSSVNLIKEIGSYKWKTDGDIILDEPVKKYDESMDAMRYAIHWWKVKNRKANKDLFRIHY